jgi:hypothetical protein
MNCMNALGLLTVPKISIIVRKTGKLADQILIHNSIMTASKKVEKSPLPRWERVGVRVNKTAFQILTSPSP